MKSPGTLQQLWSMVTYALASLVVLAGSLMRQSDVRDVRDVMDTLMKITNSDTISLAGFPNTIRIRVYTDHKVSVV